MKYFFIFLLVLSQASALEVDEILTLRIIGLSQSGKTALINRGIEDGLTVGDHAKFYVSTGVVARGVVIKSSPSRSVWSLYRLVNKSYIRAEQVLKLKITPPVKITKDESKTLVTDDSSKFVTKDPRDLGIPLADGADDLDIRDKRSTNNSSNNAVWDSSSISLLSRNREVFGMLNYSSYTVKTSPDIQGEDSYSSEVTNLSLKVGGEWYLKEEMNWYTRFSLLTYFAIDRTATMAHDGDFVSQRGSEFGFGLNFHPMTRPSRIHSMISYLNYTLILGSNNSDSQPGRGCTGSCTTSIDGSVFGHSFGYGVKYYTTQGLGLRTELSYLIRGEDYTEDEFGTAWVKTKTGPRLLFGLSYRL